MAFMFETRFQQHPRACTANQAPVQDNYIGGRDSLDKNCVSTPGEK